jgi:glutathione S-transferase
VRQFLQSVDFTLPLKDIHQDREAFLDLLQGGGRQTVPCLRIENPDGVTWLYESRDIIDYLRCRLGIPGT